MVKIRTGFVSNSSTSSFLMVGFEMGKDALKEFARSIGVDVSGDIRDWAWDIEDEAGLYVKTHFADYPLEFPFVGVEVAGGENWVSVKDIGQKLSDAFEKMEEMRDALGIPEDEDVETVLAAEGRG